MNITEAQRQALQDQVNLYMSQGYRIELSSENQKVLAKKKKFRTLLFIVCLLLGVFPAFIYGFYYAAIQKDERITLSINASSGLIETNKE